MALVLDGKNVHSKLYAERTFVKDVTGVYSVNNTGGWGTPNPDLANYVLIGVIKNVNSGSFLEAVSSQAASMEGKSNDYVTYIEFIHTTDGWHEVYLIAIERSTDGVSYVSGSTIVNGEYYYYTGSVYLKGSSAATEITDLNSLASISHSSVIIDTCNSLISNKLAKKATELYDNYRSELRKSCKTEAEKIIKEYDELTRDLRGVHAAFQRGFKYEADDIILTMTERFDID